VWHRLDWAGGTGIERSGTKMMRKRKTEGVAAVGHRNSSTDDRHQRRQTDELATAEFQPVVTMKWRWPDLLSTLFGMRGKKGATGLNARVRIG
jgi:hypothetical protein